ncbi:hypothetical protein DCAR_0103919 [Daucus carota subsp. sativus]|uniref:HVA22-like protein n=1 Tax=Daucus carota subsp. sativus TaxID=79200 RepID=A0A166IE53_DAUCS|nr:PREDICTED: putative HVA22-like protein g [Daucus carota subsp. sativus]WOG84735.1 hypothetical protein DCAR_0103919 [Daucus carota subsp. sativus]
MLGTLLSGVLLSAFGYLYPAYECFKAVEKNPPNKEQLIFWCRYWILVALLTVCERFVDVFVSWLPLYDEAKLVFIIYLWHPKTRGAEYIYENILRPVLMKHEKEIDRKLMEVWVRGKDFAVQNMQTVIYYGQIKFFEIMRFLSTQAAATQAAASQAAPAAAAAEREKAK